MARVSDRCTLAAETGGRTSVKNHAASNGCLAALTYTEPDCAFSLTNILRVSAGLRQPKASHALSRCPHGGKANSQARSPHFAPQQRAAPSPHHLKGGPLWRPAVRRANPMGAGPDNQWYSAFSNWLPYCLHGVDCVNARSLDYLPS